MYTVTEERRFAHASNNFYVKNISVKFKRSFLKTVALRGGVVITPWHGPWPGKTTETFIARVFRGLKYISPWFAGHRLWHGPWG